MTRSKSVTLLVVGFLIGIAVMGLQMATSRPLTPHFGSDINVWSSLIAVTMLSMMTGYYAGGRLVDRAPRSEVLGASVLAAALYLAVVPWLLQLDLLVDPDPFFEGEKRSILAWLASESPNLPFGAIVASLLFVFPPFTLLSFFSPFCIRLILSDAQHGGRTAGSVYSITTFGNIIGVLGTSLWLMTILGTQHIIFLFSGWLAVCGAALVALRAHATAPAMPQAEPISVAEPELRRAANWTEQR